MSRFKRIAASIIVVLLLSAGTGFIYATHYTNKYFAPPPEVTLVDSLDSDRQVQVAAGEPLNILVVGVDDKADKNKRNNTIMVYHINPASKSIGLLSIPRDTFVDIPGQGVDKVSHAYNFGGIKLCRQTIENFLGIKIDYYIETDFTGCSKIINQIGGINVYSENDIAGTGIKKGRQLLNGAQSLTYIRAYEIMGEIDQVKRQQCFLKALATQVNNYNAKWKLAIAIPDLYKSVKTDLPLDKARDLYRALQYVNQDTARFEVVPGAIDNFKGMNYWKPNTFKTHELVTKIFIEPDISDIVADAGY